MWGLGWGGFCLFCLWMSNRFSIICWKDYLSLFKLLPCVCQKSAECIYLYRSVSQFPIVLYWATFSSSAFWLKLGVVYVSPSADTLSLPPFLPFLSSLRGRRQEEREGNIDVLEKRRLVASHMPPTEGDLAGNPGVRPDQDQTGDLLFAGWCPTHSATPVRAHIFDYCSCTVSLETK